MKGVYKVLFILMAVVVGLLLIVMAISPIAKLIVERHSQDWIGRDVKVGRIFINPFAGSVTISEFECLEQNGETDFLTFEQLYVNADLWKLLAREVDLKHIHLTNFTGEVLNGDTCFNFTDIIQRFTTPDSLKKDTMPSKWSVSLNDIRLANGKLVYIDVPRDKQWSLDNVNLNVPGLYFGSRQSNAGLQFDLPDGGNVALTAGYVMNTRRYALTLNLDEVNTDIALPLIQDYLHVDALGAALSGKIHVDGSLDNLRDIVATCNLDIAHLKMPFTDKKVKIAASQISIDIDKGRLLTKGFAASSLSVDMNGVTYSDHTMKHDFDYTVNSLNLSGKSFSTNSSNNTVKLSANLMNGGKFKVDYTGGLDFKNGANVIIAKLTGLHVEDFSPYCESYMGYPLNGGVLALQSSTGINLGKLNSDNTITIDQMEVGNKLRHTDAPYKNIPLKAGVGLLKSAKGTIVLEVPVVGDVSSPKFKLGKVIGRAILKVFFGPLMGVRDDRKMISGDEFNEMMNILGEDSVELIGAADSLVVEMTATDVTVAASDSLGLAEIAQ